MTEPLNEQLSACLDAQLPEAELDLLLKRVAREPELRETLGRYALVSEALRGKGAARASAGFADRVAAAIATDSVIPQRNSRVSPAMMRWLRPAAGAAVAAGVAAMAVFSLQPVPEPAVVAQAAPSASSADSYIVPSNTVTSYVPATRLTNYVVAHSEYSSPLGRRTVLSGVLSEEDDGGDPAMNADSVGGDLSGGVMPVEDSPASAQRP